MKSIVKQTIYAGIGLLGVGTHVAKNLGEALAKKAGVTEKEGERIARKMEAQSSQAAKAIRRTIDAEVTRVANAIHSAIREDVHEMKNAHSNSKHRSSAKRTRKNKSHTRSNRHSVV